MPIFFSFKKRKLSSNFLNMQEVGGGKKGTFPVSYIYFFFFTKFLIWTGSFWRAEEIWQWNSN